MQPKAFLLPLAAALTGTSALPATSPAPAPAPLEKRCALGGILGMGCAAWSGIGVQVGGSVSWGGPKFCATAAENLHVDINVVIKATVGFPEGYCKVGEFRTKRDVARLYGCRESELEVVRKGDCGGGGGACGCWKRPDVEMCEDCASCEGGEGQGECEVKGEEEDDD